MILYHFRLYSQTQPLPVATTGRMELLEHGHCRRIRRGHRTFSGTTGRTEQRTAPPNPHGPQDLPGTTGRPEQRTDRPSHQWRLRAGWSCWGVGTAAASAGAIGPFPGLRAGQSSGRTKPEYTAARGRHDHVTYRKRADASVRCTGLGVKPLCANVGRGQGRVRCSIIADYSGL